MSEQKFTNEELAQRVIDGDHEALNLLYNKNKGLIIKKCKEAYDNEPLSFSVARYILRVCAFITLLNQE